MTPTKLPFVLVFRVGRGPLHHLVVYYRSLAEAKREARTELLVKTLDRVRVVRVEEVGGLRGIEARVRQAGLGAFLGGHPFETVYRPGPRSPARSQVRFHPDFEAAQLASERTLRAEFHGKGVLLGVTELR
jgi:hypothetical protein